MTALRPEREDSYGGAPYESYGSVPYDAPVGSAAYEPVADPVP